MPDSVPPAAVPPDAVPPDAVPPDAVPPDAVPPDAVPAAPLPPLEACGFVRVPADAPLWMKCDSCTKSDHFWLDGERVRCRCGASYSHAVRPDGSQVPVSQLTAVPFAQGPRELADLEWDPKRLAIIGAVVALLLVGIWLALR